MYRDFLVEGLTNLARVEKGDSFEEDHQRGHQMTVNFLIEKGAVKQVTQNGRTYWTVVDYDKMHAAVGELLSKLMVIKATGDYEGIRELVTQKGIKFDPKLRDEVAQRVKAADVPAVLFINAPRLVPVVDDKGQVTDVKVDTAQGFIEQHLEKSVLGKLPPAEATKTAARLASSPEALKEAFKTLMPAPPAEPPPREARGSVEARCVEVRRRTLNPHVRALPACCGGGSFDALRHGGEHRPASGTGVRARRRYSACAASWRGAGFPRGCGRRATEFRHRMEAYDTDALEAVGPPGSRTQGLPR